MNALTPALHATTTAVPATQAPAPAPTAEAPPPVADAVILGAAPVPSRRPLFVEANSLGLMQSGAIIGGPLGQALSAAAQQDLGALLDQVQAAGLRLDRHGNPDNLSQYGNTTLGTDSVQRLILESNGKFADVGLTVSGPDMNFTRINHLSELEGLEALAVKRDPAPLPDPSLGRTLLDMSQAGLRFYVNGEDEDRGQQVLENLSSRKAREVGPYGAWRALNEPPPPPVDPDTSAWSRPRSPDIQRLWIGREDPKPMSFSFNPSEIPSRINNLDALETAAFFELGQPSDRLQADHLACSLRDLEMSGFTFHFDNEKNDKHRPALAVYEDLQRADFARVVAGVRGSGKEPVTVEQLRDPSLLSDKLKDMSRFFEGHVAARLADGRFTDREADIWMQAMAVKVGNQTMEQKAELIEKQYAFEQEIASPQKAQAIFAAKTLAWVGKLLRDGESPDALVAEMQDLARRKLHPDVAGEAVQHFRSKLPMITFDEQDFQTQREQLLQLASIAGSFKNALEGSALIAYTLPFEEGLALLRTTMETDKELKVPEKPFDINDFSLKDEPRPFEQAMEDYKLVLSHRLPTESAGHAAAALRALHTVLVPALGYESSRQAFTFLQRGSAHRAFGEHTRDEAVSTFLQNFIVKKDLEQACRAVLRMGRNGDAAKVTTDEATGDIIVGGIRIHKRPKGE